MLRYLLVPLAAAALAVPAATHTHKKNGLEIIHPWTRESPGNATPARIFMTVKSLNGRPDRLVSASTPRAGKVELDAAGNGPLAFVLQRGKDLVLHADGPNLKLTGLKTPLSAYDDFKMTLVFERAGRIAIDVMVEE
jgi:copper(I)-binding protein